MSDYSRINDQKWLTSNCAFALKILKEGNAAKEQKSNYAENYRFFQATIERFLNEYPSFFSYLPTRILNNCILLPIEAESQNTALRIFSTLNDRGKPLSDADIFKSQFYKKDGYRLLKNEDTFENLIVLADFWNDVSVQNVERFSERILRRLFVLNYAPNGMWTFFVSVYFMANKDENNLLSEDEFYDFLNRITAFIWTYAVTNPGVNALRTPVYAEMVNIVNGLPVEFSDFRFDAATVENMFNNFSFNNSRPITKSMLTWWAFNELNQCLLSLDTTYEIEHIFARSRQDKEKSLSSDKRLEMLGNKALLEKRINIRASDYRFEDKARYYQGFTNNRNQRKEGTQIQELITFADTKSDFQEADINERNNRIMTGFLKFLEENNLIK